MKQSTEAIIFDLDGTLINLNVDWVNVKKKLQSIFKINFNPLFLKIIELKRSERIKAYEIIKKFERKSYGKWEINTSLVNWIKKNHKQYRILLLTNNSRETTERFLIKSNLEQFIEFSICIDETDFPKPHNSGLQSLLNLQSVDKNKVLLVGDSIREKILAENNNLDYIIENWFSVDVFDLLQKKVEQKKQTTEGLSLIILSKNEEKIIHDNLMRTLNYLKDLEIVKDFEILVCDKSDDNTVNLVKKISEKHKEIKLIKVQKTGIGAGSKAGIDNASYNLVSINGADLPTGLDFIKRSIEKIKNDFDLIVSIRGNQGFKDNRPLKRKLFSKTYNLLVNFFFNLKIADMQSAITFNRKKIMDFREKLIDDGPFLQTEIIINARRNNLKIFQMNTDYDDNRKDSKIQVFRFSIDMFKKIIKKRMEFGLWT